MIAQEPLDDRYFAWLYSQIGLVRSKNPRTNYWYLAKMLYKTEFQYFIPNDDNRAADGVQLREEFLDLSPFDELDSASEWLSLGCSFFEMLVALARRASFESPSRGHNTPGDWFWKIMRNLGLDHINDAVFDEEAEVYIESVLEVVNERTYRPDGRGGMFPLNEPQEDQRTTEIWYQMAAYLLEQMR